MLKTILLLCVLGATAFQNLAEAQSRGRGPTRADRERWEQMNRHRPYYPPVVVVPQHRPVAPLGLITEAATGRLIGCEIRAHGRLNQLFVNGAFSGNFEMGYDDLRLASALDSYLYQGVCRRISTYEMQVRSNPYLIEDFASGRSRNCHVRLNVAGWANQLYVNGNFEGNFDNRTEVERLRQVIADQILNGRCQY